MQPPPHFSWRVPTETATKFCQDPELYHFISKTHTGKRKKDYISYILKTNEKYIKKKKAKTSERTKQGVLAIVKRSRWDGAFKE